MTKLLSYLVWFCIGGLLMLIAFTIPNSCNIIQIPIYDTTFIYDTNRVQINDTIFTYDTNWAIVYDTTHIIDTPDCDNFTIDARLADSATKQQIKAIIELFLLRSDSLPNVP